MTRKGYSIEIYMEKDALEQLQACVLTCIRIIGDTACRANQVNIIKWIVEKEIVIAGRYAEHTDNHPENSVNTTDALKQCIVLVNEKQMDRCYLGLHKVLMDIIVYRKTEMTLKLDIHRNYSCLQDLLHHCDNIILRSLEEVLLQIFGVCIKVTPKWFKGACNDDITVRRYCEDSDVKKIHKKVEKCTQQSYDAEEFSRLRLIKKLDVMTKCLDMTANKCVYSQWEVFREMLGFLLQKLQETPGSKEDAPFLKHLHLKNLKHCAQKLVSLFSTLVDTKTGIKKPVRRSVKQCFKSTLGKKSCSNVCEKFIKALTAAANFPFDPDDDDDDDDDDDAEIPSIAYRSIDSIKVRDGEISICESEFQEGFGDDRMSAEDICVPLLSSDDSSSTQYILMKSCLADDVTEWLSDIKKCMSPKVYSIGVENPDSLTLSRVTDLLKSCLNGQKYLKCRPKERKELRSMINSLFYTIKMFAVPSGNNSCMEDLEIENVAKCLNNLHQYLVFQYHLSEIQREKKKSLECLKKTLKRCPPAFIEDVLSMLQESIQISTYKASGSGNDYVTCEPGNKLQGKPWGAWCEPWPVVRNSPTRPYVPDNAKKAMKSLYRSSDMGENSLESEEIEDSKEEKQNETHHQSIQIFGLTSNYCIDKDYSQYFEMVFACQNIRMHALIYKDGDNCEYDDLKKSLEAIALCILENKDKLNCSISSKSHVKDFLVYLSTRLDNNVKNYRNNCPDVKPCYESAAVSISQCADVIYDELNTSVVSASKSKKGFVKVLKCIKSLWPHCSTNISLLMLPSIYIPLGMNLSAALTETEHQRCLSTEINQIGDTSECTDHQMNYATKVIYDCLNRTIERIKESLHFTTEALHWQIIPLTVCVTMHPILECRQTDLYKFKEFMQKFLNNIRNRLQDFLNIFKDEKDLKQGEKCMRQFSSPILDRCLSLMFGYMTSVYVGHANDYDYPSECVEDIFRPCGDMNTFHLFMKKSMNVSEKQFATNELPTTSKEICFDIDNNGFELFSCRVPDFEKALLTTNDCLGTDYLNEDRDFLNIKKTLIFCKNCILRDVEEMCVYTLPDLRTAATSAFDSIAKCANKSDMEGKCVHDAMNEVMNNCISTFHSYSTNLMSGAVMQAAQFANQFYSCIEKTASHCPSDTFQAIFDIYHRISGLERLSNLQKEYAR